jgi:hypothetical protein
MPLQDRFRRIGLFNRHQASTYCGHEQAGGIYDAPTTKTSHGFTLEPPLLVRSHKPSVASREDDAGSLASAKGPSEVGVSNEIFRIRNCLNPELLVIDSALELLPLHRSGDLG